MAAKKKSAKQVRFLFSEGSPLSESEKETLHGEISSGEVKVKGGKRAIGSVFRGKTRKRIKKETQARIRQMRV
ncbi:MAG: hypothetical protein GTO63_30230 [Anaerolineae bacterium]|nr:hypothetical protein [Anaerolineae bacterium]NIN98983.1 hypothetical protein [Anaerolineae bacterium]